MVLDKKGRTVVKPGDNVRIYSADLGHAFFNPGVQRWILSVNTAKRTLRTIAPYAGRYVVKDYPIIIGFPDEAILYHKQSMPLILQSAELCFCDGEDESAAVFFMATTWNERLDILRNKREKAHDWVLGGG